MGTWKQEMLPKADDMWESVKTTFGKSTPIRNTCQCDSPGGHVKWTIVGAGYGACFAATGVAASLGATFGTASSAGTVLSATLPSAMVPGMAAASGSLAAGGTVAAEANVATVLAAEAAITAGSCSAGSAVGLGAVMVAPFFAVDGRQGCQWKKFSC